MAAPMIVDNGKKTQELKLNQPKAFSGKRDELTEFVQDVQLYLAVNDDVYNTDKKKIAFVLSFMSEGDVKSWNGQFLQHANKPTGLDLNMGTVPNRSHGSVQAIRRTWRCPRRTHSVKDGE
jgi:hypothetical protein